MMTYLIIGLYLFLTFGLSLIGSKRSHQTPEDYFLAGRGIGPLVLFFTFIATNFSAFFFLGFAGAGYKIGYPFYAMMGFGTAFAALSFYFIGFKVWKLGKEKGYITPPELIGDLSGSSLLANLHLLVLIVFTLPYLALQPIGAGYLLESLTNGGIPYFGGASLLTLFIVIYVFVGGMQSVALTDVKQGILMFVLMFLAVVVIAGKFGGITAANEQVYALKPELFSREGAGGFFNGKKWFSNMILWLVCVPMFPQLFMRFFVSKDARSFKTTTILYALIPSFLFILPVMIGVMGHLSFPDLVGKEADQILPKMLSLHTPEWMAALIMTGALAAFMSTLDSQLLALGTIFSRDVYRKYFNPNLSLAKEVRVGQFFIVLLSLVGLLIAYNPPDSIFALAKQAFTGYAVLFPSTLAVLYLGRNIAPFCVLSIIVGESIVLAVFMGWLNTEHLWGFDPIVPILLISFFIILVGFLWHKLQAKQY